MAGKVTKEQTWSYADALAARGEEVTTTAVHDLYGKDFGKLNADGTRKRYGNPTMISGHLKEWRTARHGQPHPQRPAAETPGAGDPPPPEFQAVLTTLNALWTRLQQQTAQAAEEARRQARASAKATLDAALAEKQVELDELEAERVALAEAASQEADAHDALARQVADLTRQLASVTGERDQTRRDLATRTEERDTATAALHAAETRTRDFETAEAALRADAAEKDSALRELRAQLKAAEDRAADADARETRAQTRADAADTRARDAQKAIEQARAAADARISAAEQTAQKALAEATAALEHADQRIRLVEEEAQRAKDAAEARVAAAERRAADAEARAAGAMRGNGPTAADSPSSPS